LSQPRSFRRNLPILLATVVAVAFLSAAASAAEPNLKALLVSAEESLQREDLATANDEFRKVLQLARESHDLNTQAAARCGIARALPDPFEAPAQLRLALSLHRQLHDAAGEALDLFTLGESYQLRGYLDKAHQVLTEALAIERQQGLHGEEARTLAQLAIIQRMRGSYEVEVVVPRGTADLSLQLSDSPDPVTAGGLLAYTISVANAGPDEAVSLTVTDTLPAGTAFLAAGGPWTCSHDAGTVACSLASLPAGSSTTLTLFVSAPTAGGPTLNQAVVAAFQADPNQSNNSRTEQTFVNGPPAGTGLSFYTVTPCRVVDTRQSLTPLGSGITQTFAVVGVCGIPAEAQAVSLNATAVGGTAGGYVTLFPADQSLPTTTTISFQTGQTRANSAVLGLSSNGRLAARATLTGGSVHLILDVSGYFAVAHP